VKIVHKVLGRGSAIVSYSPVIYKTFYIGKIEVKTHTKYQLKTAITRGSTLCKLCMNKTVVTAVHHATM